MVLSPKAGSVGLTPDGGKSCHLSVVLVQSGSRGSGNRPRLSHRAGTRRREDAAKIGARGGTGVYHHVRRQQRRCFPPRSSDIQYADMHDRWRIAFGQDVPLQFIPVSKRIKRSVHDRKVQAKTQSGKQLVWDIGRGIDGRRQCRAACENWSKGNALNFPNHFGRQIRLDAQCLRVARSSTHRIS